jgi:antitoxin component YwqK of YwqJK toxin-antitoxin module
MQTDELENFYNLYKQHIDDKNIVYMSYLYHIIFLSKLDNTKTNENRSNILYPKTSLHKGDIFRVILIVDKRDATTILKSIGSYIIGDIIGLNDKLSIKYYLSLKCAFFLQLKYEKITGHYNEWFSNGCRRVICKYDEESKLHGDYYEWYDNKDKKKKYTYLHGVLHGEYIEWYRSYLSLYKINLNTKSLFCDYVFGQCHGQLNMWHENSTLWTSCVYTNGILNGKYYKWHTNGKQWINATYENGIRTSFLEKTKRGLILFCDYGY